MIATLFRVDNVHARELTVEPISAWVRFLQHRAGAPRQSALPLNGAMR